MRAPARFRSGQVADQGKHDPMFRGPGRIHFPGSKPVFAARAATSEVQALDENSVSAPETRFLAENRNFQSLVISADSGFRPRNLKSRRLHQLRKFRFSARNRNRAPKPGIPDPAQLPKLSLTGRIPVPCPKTGFPIPARTSDCESPGHWVAYGENAVDSRFRRTRPARLEGDAR